MSSYDCWPLKAPSSPVVFASCRPRQLEFLLQLPLLRPTNEHGLHRKNEKYQLLLFWQILQSTSIWTSLVDHLHWVASFDMEKQLLPPPTLQPSSNAPLRPTNYLTLIGHRKIYLRVCISFTIFRWWYPCLAQPWSSRHVRPSTLPFDLNAYVSPHYRFESILREVKERHAVALILKLHFPRAHVITGQESYTDELQHFRIRPCSAKKYREYNDRKEPILNANAAKIILQLMFLHLVDLFRIADLPESPTPVGTKRAIQIARNTLHPVTFLLPTFCNAQDSKVRQRSGIGSSRPDVLPGQVRWG